MAKQFPKDDELCKVIGLNIRRLRRDKELTQAELGKAFGMAGNKAISDWETGNSDITVSQLKAVADFLGVKTWDEFTRTDWMGTEENPSPLILGLILGRGKRRA